jgi:hypothetical protein
MCDCQWYHSSWIQHNHKQAACVQLHGQHSLTVKFAMPWQPHSSISDAAMIGQMLLLLLTTRAVPVLKLMAAMPALGARTV